VLVFTTIEMRNESTSFLGLADTTEIIINSESPVEIKKMRITPGQGVKKGDTLVELSSYELEIRINETRHLIDELKTKSSAQVTLTKAQEREMRLQVQNEINQLNADLDPKIADYNQKMAMLDIVMHGKKINNPGKDASLVEIESLKKQIEHKKDSIEILIQSIRSQGAYAGLPLEDQRKRAQEDLRLLEEEKKKLFIVSPISGLIGTVYFKDGERASPFTTIATLHGQSPMFINGFIHENAYTMVKVGQQVRIESLTEPKVTLIGTVTGVSSRIVEYPVRLRKISDLQMWGRQIIIKIPENNRLLMGEKVIISFMNQKKLLGFF
jgi:HlyD family secretion protein